VNVRDRRVQYETAGLDRHDLDESPIQQWHAWYVDALEAGLPEPNAMAIASVDDDGLPDSRIVLARGVDDEGITFFGNYESAKGRDLTRQPRACLLFFWAELERQVRITGRVDRLTPDESLAYFRSRPRGSQLGAWASPQSRVIASRDVLDDALAQLETTYADGDIPLPPFWGGYRVIPDAVEFWQGRTSRLHDRLLYSRDGDHWARVRLAP